MTAKTVFGTSRLSLPAADFALDEDGWVDFRNRLSGRDYVALTAPAASTYEAFPQLVTAWSLKIDGQDIPYDRDSCLDLPVDLVVAVIKAIDDNAGIKRSIASLKTGAV